MKFRFFGFFLLGISAAAFYALTHLVALPAADRSGLLELATGTVCVAAEMVGLPMVALGAGLFAPTEIPPRSWYPVRGIRRLVKAGDDDAAPGPLSTERDSGLGAPASFAVAKRRGRASLPGAGILVEHGRM